VSVRPPAARGLPYFLSSRWLPLAISLLLLALLAKVLLDHLDRAEAASEKLMLELTLRNMTVGLQAAKGDALVAGREQEIASWQGQNPIRWLGEGLHGYQGPCATAGHSLPGGQWCFDEQAGELIYAVKKTAYVHDQSGAELALLRWRVARPAMLAPGVGSVLALKIEPVEAVVWSLP